MPVSFTLMTACVAVLLTVMSMLPPSKVYFMALDRRLLTTLSKLMRSIHTCSGSSSCSVSSPCRAMVMPRSLALKLKSEQMARTKSRRFVSWQCRCIWFLSILRSSSIWFTSSRRRCALRSMVCRSCWLSLSVRRVFSLLSGPMMRVSGDRMSCVALMRNFIFVSSSSVLRRCS